MPAPHKALTHFAFSVSQKMNILFSVIIDNYKQSGQEATVYALVCHYHMLVWNDFTKRNGYASSSLSTTARVQKKIQVNK